MRWSSFLLVFPLLFVTYCGGSSDDLNSDDAGEIVNTEKLVGTPFEGMETGDDLPWSTFFCGSYRTETVDRFPIEIFAAFFTADQEAVIQEGIDIANTAMGIEGYALTDVWRDDLRVIYKVMEIIDEDQGDFSEAGGITPSLTYDFNGKIWAEAIPADWIIEVRTAPLSKWLIAHELGHASGIEPHMKINYENDELVDLEENSLMSALMSSDTFALGDYTFMMTKQTEIIESHFGEMGLLSVDFCLD